MKRTIILLLVAVFSVATMYAQETKKAIYVIDGKKVENFDGSQLQGKTVAHYSIDPEYNIHTILTTDFVGDKQIKRVKVFSYSKADSIPLSQRHIADIETRGKLDSLKSKLKPGETKVGLIKSTMQGKGDDMVHVLNDKIVPISEIVGLSQSNIASMTVIKDKQSAEYKKYAKEAGREPKCIIKITTK